MYQTLYIDADEEVNSIISRIRKSLAKYNILVVTHGALVMQSAVSLKLIKREAESLGKKVMIVTKDEQAASIAKKIGFLVKSSLEDLKGLDREGDVLSKKVLSNNDNFSIKNVSVDETRRALDKNNRLSSLGGESFFVGDGVSRGGTDLNNRGRVGIKNISVDESVNQVKVTDNTQENFSTEDEEAFRNLFDGTSPKIDSSKKEISANKKNSNFIFWLIFLFLLLVILVAGAYLYLPSAKVTVFPKKSEELIVSKMEVLDNLSSGESGVIYLKPQVIESENVLSLSFPATGQKNSSNQKAKGKILIYNEFSETSQVLVATTRILSNEDKLFRLINTVTVPGMSVKNGTMEPGTAEADIIADESGEGYNIKEGEFKIPGFKGSSKYDKFYAKLVDETKGGGGGGGELKTVSGSDIESAKIKTENQLKEKLKEEIKSKLGKDNILFDNAISFEVVDFSVFPEEDSVTENFEYQVKIKIKGIAFSAEELDEKANELIKNKIAQRNISQKIVGFSKEYGNASVDFAKRTIKTELKIKAEIKSEVNGEKVANYLVGRDKDEIADIVDSFPEINKIEASISPDFISNSFPRYLSRIKVEIED